MLKLAFNDDIFDVAAMALVIAFLPDPGAAVAEMARVVRPGGLVTARRCHLGSRQRVVGSVD